MVQRPPPLGGLPVTVIWKLWLLRAPQAFVWIAVAVQDWVGDRVCARALPLLPHPDQLQLPPVVGCGASCRR
jgi:hypothetical protein